jgi:hypothetical protein
MLAGGVARILVVAAIMLAIGLYGGMKLERRKGSRPIAIVNGETINENELARAVTVSAASAVLQRLIDDKLVIQYASQQGKLPDQKTIDAKYTELAANSNLGVRPDASVRTPDEIKHSLLVTLCRQAIETNQTQLQPAAIRAFYDKNVDPKNPKARYYHPEVVIPEIIATKSLDEGNKAMAELKRGVPFAEVVQKYSVDNASRAHNGLGPPIRRGTISQFQYPRSEHILFDQMRVGDTVGPIQFGPIWWICHCLKREAEYTDSFDKVQGDCKTQVLLQSREGGQDGEDLVIERLRKVANVTVLWPQLSSLSHTP